MIVSVVIPCYNVESYIEKCVASVLEQHVSPLEIICVDNNSTDNTGLFLEQLAKQHSAIKILKEPRKGANYARNTGLSVASGEWIQFLDADDVLLPGKLTHQLNITSKVSEKVAFIAGACFHESLKGQRKIRLLEENLPKELAVFVGQSGNTCSNLWRRKALVDCGAWNETLQSSQEAELMMRLIQQDYELFRDNKPLTLIYDRAGGQISQTNHEDRLLRYLNVRFAYIERLIKERKNQISFDLNAMYDFLSVTILQLARYNAEKAEEIFKTQIKPNWKPSGKYGMSMKKAMFLRLVGPKWMVKLLK